MKAAGGKAPQGAPASRRARLLLWVVPLMWSSNYIVARLSHDAIAPHALAAGRWALAALLLLPFAGPGLWARRAVLRREWKQLLGLGFFGMYICGAWVYLAGGSTTATNIALIYAVSPMAIAVAGAKLLHERMASAQWAGVAMALAGLLLVISGGDLGRLLQVRFGAGDLWAAAAAASWVVYSVLLRRWPSELDPWARLLAVMCGGLVWLLPATLMEAVFTPTPDIGLRGVALVVLAAVLPGVLSYGAYSFLQRELGVARTALMLYLAPVYAAMLAWALLGELPGWHHAAGALLILPSIWLATRGNAQPKSPGAKPASSSSA